MGPTWGPYGADRTQMGPMLAPWTLLSGTMLHFNDVIMSPMVFEITRVSIVCSAVCSEADQRQHQSSASPAFARVTHRWPVNSPHKGSVTGKMLPFDDIIMQRSTAAMMSHTAYYASYISHYRRNTKYILERSWRRQPDVSVVIFSFVLSQWHALGGMWLPHRLGFIFSSKI